MGAAWRTPGVVLALPGTLLLFEAVLAAIVLLGYAYLRGYVPLAG